MFSASSESRYQCLIGPREALRRFGVRADTGPHFPSPCIATSLFSLLTDQPWGFARWSLEALQLTIFVIINSQNVRSASYYSARALVAAHAHAHRKSIRRSSSGMVTPAVSLKERIAALQQRNAGSPPHSTSPVPGSRPISPSPNGASASPPAAGNSGGGSSGVGSLRAKFEQKGGTPVPRGSFGMGVSVLDDGSSNKRRGEMYGNRVSGLSKTTYVPGGSSRSVSSSSLSMRRGSDSDHRRVFSSTDTPRSGTPALDDSLDGSDYLSSRAASPSLDPISPNHTGTSLLSSPPDAPEHMEPPTIVVSSDPTPEPDASTQLEDSIDHAPSSSSTEDIPSSTPAITETVAIPALDEPVVSTHDNHEPTKDPIPATSDVELDSQTVNDPEVVAQDMPSPAPIREAESTYEPEVDSSSSVDVSAESPVVVSEPVVLASPLIADTVPEPISLVTQSPAQEQHDVATPTETLEAPLSPPVTPSSPAFPSPTTPAETVVTPSSSKSDRPSFAEDVFSVQEDSRSPPATGASDSSFESGPVRRPSVASPIIVTSPPPTDDGERIYERRPSVDTVRDSPITPASAIPGSVWDLPTASLPSPLRDLSEDSPQTPADSTVSPSVYSPTSAGSQYTFGVGSPTSLQQYPESPLYSGEFTPSLDGSFDTSLGVVNQAEILQGARVSPISSKMVFVPPSPATSFPPAFPATPTIAAEPTPAPESQLSSPQNVSEPHPSSSFTLLPSPPTPTYEATPAPKSFTSVVGRRTTIKKAAPRPETVVYAKEPPRRTVEAHTVTDADISFTGDDLSALLANAAMLEQHLATGRVSTPRKEVFSVPPVPHAAPNAPSSWANGVQPRKSLEAKRDKAAHVRGPSHGRTDSNSTLKAVPRSIVTSRKSSGELRNHTPAAKPPPFDRPMPDVPVTPVPEFPEFSVQELELTLPEAPKSRFSNDSAPPPTPPPKSPNPPPAESSSMLKSGLRSLKSSSTLRRVSMLLHDDSAGRHSIISSEDSAAVVTPPYPDFDPQVLVTPPGSHSRNTSHVRDDGASYMSKESRSSGWSSLKGSPRKGKGLARAATFADKIWPGSRRSRAPSTSSVIDGRLLYYVICKRLCLTSYNRGLYIRTPRSIACAFVDTSLLRTGGRRARDADASCPQSAGDTRRPEPPRLLDVQHQLVEQPWRHRPPRPTVSRRTAGPSRTDVTAPGYRLTAAAEVWRGWDVDDTARPYLVVGTSVDVCWVQYAEAQVVERVGLHEGCYR
jgi:hypothetical protein